MNGEFILVGVFFILIMFVCTYGSSKEIVGYVPTDSNLHLYPYEGFIGGELASGNEIPMSPQAIDPSNQKDISFDIPRSEFLQGSDYSKPSSVIDSISQLPSRPDCIGNSANLSNSTGGICLDETTRNLIKTRGNNQTY